MRAKPCPAPDELSRAFSLGTDTELQAHLAECLSCAAEWKALTELRGLGKEVPYTVPDKAHRDRIRQRLEGAVANQLQQRRPRVPQVVWWMTAAAVLGILWSVRSLPHRLEPIPPSMNFRASVYPHGSATFVHQRVGGDEWVALSDGTLRVEVSPLRPGERFRVRAGDGEVEVRGTAFDTVVDHDHLVRVEVRHGRVEVRPQLGPMVVLGTGDHWQAKSGLAATSYASVSPPPVESPIPLPAPAAIPALLPPPGPVAKSEAAPRLPVNKDVPSVAAGPPPTELAAASEPPVTAPGPPPPAADPQSVAASLRSSEPAPASEPPLAARGPPPLAGAVASKPTWVVGRPMVPTAGSTAPAVSPAERFFDEGWSALRRGDYAGAAVSFQRADSGGSDAIVEDARFWRAVALGRAGQTDAAVTEMGAFLSRYPGSPRRGEAASILGWQLLQLGQLDSAESHFQTAAADSRPEIRSNASFGLAAVASQRKKPPPGPGAVLPK